MLKESARTRSTGTRGPIRTLSALVAIGLLLGLGAIDALGAITWSGQWSRTTSELLPGDEGTMTLTQVRDRVFGDGVFGSYTWSGGGSIMNGKLSDDGKTLDGDFADQVCSGRFSISLEGGEDFQAYDGDFECTAGPGAGASGPFSGECISGGCTKNEPSVTNWLWWQDARRAVRGPRPWVIGSSRRYQLRRVDVFTRGDFEAGTTKPTAVNGRGFIRLRFLKVAGPGPRKITRVLRLGRFSASAFGISSTGRTLRLVARVRSRFPRCRSARARIVLFAPDRATGRRTFVSLRLLQPCRIPGGLRAITFRRGGPGQRAVGWIRPQPLG